MTYEEAEKELCVKKELCSYNFTRAYDKSTAASQG